MRWEVSDAIIVIYGSLIAVTASPAACEGTAVNLGSMHVL